jgi:hypothetical protein
MIGLFLSFWVFVLNWALSGRGVEAALSSGATFLFFWVAFWALSLALIVGSFLLIGGALLLRLPPPVRAIAAPFFLTGGVRALISRPVWVWLGSVALVLWGASVLRQNAAGSDGLLGAWLVAVGFLTRNFAWSELKAKAQVRVFQGGVEPVVSDEDPIVVVEPGSRDAQRYESAVTVQAEEERR